MLRRLRPFRRCCALLLAAIAPSHAQTVNASQQVLLEGLLTANNHGSFNAAVFGPDGSLYLLLDEHDGLRVMKTNASATSVLAQAHAGSIGDSGLAMALDASGSVYVAGTSTSGSLSGTSGTAFPARADTSTNSFVAKFDANLNLAWLSFLGAGRTAVSSIAATSDAVFVTGITFNTAFPVTSAGIQQSPAQGSSENGFVERFTTSGSLVYATYLTGADGDTMPAAIVADSLDNAYISGTTTASGLPTIAALQPAILGIPSGFLTKLTPAGDGFVFSTFIAGSGITGMALDAASSSLLLSGNISLGQFPVATVAMPLAATSYQTMLRIPLDGQTVSSSVVVAAGSTSHISVGANGSAWLSGSLTLPLFPGQTPPDYAAGDSFLVHLASSNSIDQTLRFGGLPTNNTSYASLGSSVAAPAVSADGATIALPGSVTATLASSLVSTQRFDLPTVQTPNAVLANTLREVVPNATVCGTSSQCVGSGAYLALVSTSGGAALSWSADALPNLTLRNLGSAAADGLTISASGYTVASNCGSTLPPSQQCSVALTGSGPGSMTVSASGTANATMALGTNTTTPDALALSVNEVDFGIVSSVSGVETRTIGVTNLSSTAQTFGSTLDGALSPDYALAETTSDCGTSTHTLAPGAACHITLGFTASISAANDGSIVTYWKIGTRDVKITAFSQAAALSVSATEIDFGTQFTGVGALRLPRYLYLSNSSTSAVAHSAAAFAAGSPFVVVDECPSMLPPRSVCRMTLTYSSATAPSSDSATLQIDVGLSVLVTGTTLQPASVTGSATNPNVSVTPSAVSFGTPVDVTGVSSGTQTIVVTNTGGSALSLTIGITGDFKLTNGCGPSLGAGASCSLLVGFAPSQPGVRDGLLSVTAGTGFSPTYVTLSGTGSAILPANNGTLNIGTTLAGEPVVQWYQVQQSLATLTASSGSSAFGVALVADIGSGHGTLPASSFNQTATAACGSCWLGVQFLPQQDGAASTTLTLSSVAAGNPYVLTLAGTAVPVQGLLISPMAQDFGTVAVDSTSAPMTFVVTNLLGSATGATIQSVTATGDFVVASSSTAGPSCVGMLAPTASCFVGISFAPTATGARTGSLTIVTSSGSVTSMLTGDATSDPGLALVPNAIVFNNVAGVKATQQIVTLTNTGNAVATFGAMTVNGTGFAMSTNCATLAVGASCTATVTFTPQTSLLTGSLNIPLTRVVNGQTIAESYSVALSAMYASNEAGLVLSPGSANFGPVATGSIGATQQFTLSNLTAKTLAVSLAMPRQFPLAAAAPCVTLTPGASCTFDVSFVPVTGGELTGSVSVTGVPSDGSPAVVALGYMIGYGDASGTLTMTGAFAPGAALGFGQVSSGQSASQAVTLTNNGADVVTVRRITSEPPFYATSNCGSALSSGAACTVTLTYAPSYEVSSSSTAGTRTDQGALTVESDAAASPQMLSLVGYAVPVVSANPASSAVLNNFTLSQSALTFANTQVGNASAAQTITLTNDGTTTIHVAGVTAPADFTAAMTCGTQLPGATCTIRVQMTPGNASTATVRSGTVEIASDADAALEFVSVIGTSAASPLTLSPTTLSFGSVNVGAMQTQNVMVTNTTAAPVTFRGVSATGDYGVAIGTCPAMGSTLAANSSCVLSVTFAPTTTGSRDGTLSLTSDATQLPLTVSLTGTGVAAHLTVSPGSVDFGSIYVGATATMSFTLTNSGSAPVTGIAAAVSGTNAADFVVAGPCAATLAVGASCAVGVAFTPSAAGARSASVTVASSDTGGPLSVGLSGTGLAFGSFLLTVNGASSATATVKSGSPAAYSLVLTPMNGFSGTVALTCTPVIPAQYASCSLLSPTLAVNGSAVSATATINTITSLARIGLPFAAWVLFAPLPFLARRRKLMQHRNRWLTLVLLLAGEAVCVSMTACGGSSGGGSSNVRYTPAGTYQYVVTASSTGGTVVTSSVTLNLVVQ